MTQHGPSPPLRQRLRRSAATVIWICEKGTRAVLLLLVSCDADGVLLRAVEVLGEETRGAGCVSNAA